MRKLRSGVYIESRYPGVILGVVPSEGELLLVDLPLRTDDGRDWIGQLTSLGRPRYIAMMDQHPDRALGARAFDYPLRRTKRSKRCGDGQTPLKEAPNPSGRKQTP